MSDETSEVATDDAEETYLQAVNRFVDAADYLGEQHRPAIKVLRAIAKALDADEARGKAPQAALVGQFGLTYRDLAKLAPSARGGSDPLDDSMPPALWDE